MESSSISSRLIFLREAERLKDTLRSVYTTSDRAESVAEHTWRLTLLAITFAISLVSELASQFLQGATDYGHDSLSVPCNRIGTHLLGRTDLGRHCPGHR